MKMRTWAKKLPGPLKRTLKAAYGALPPRLRLSRAFWETYQFLEESQWWDSARLQEYQMRELGRLLAQCYENVPYYRRVFDERGLRPADILTPADLPKLPYLRKEQIRKDPRAFLARNRRIDRLEWRSTTGTSGQPLQFLVDRDELEREWAFAFHQWGRVGYRPGDARAEVRGQHILGGRPFEWNPVLRVLRLSPVVQEKDTVALYLETIRSYGIRFLYGYPSAITHLACLVKRYGCRADLGLTAILYASETLYPWQRAVAEEVFQCRSYNFYGQAEHVAMAGECEASHAFHFLPQYGVTEVDPQTGEITGTGFLNQAHPFIRYRMGDVTALPTAVRCEKCGRECQPVVPDIQGRLQDFVVTPEGTPFCHCVLAFPFKVRRAISRAQIVQESLGRVILRGAPVDDKDMRQFTDELGMACHDLQEILGSGVSIRQELIPAEECTGPGKFRFIVSHLPDHIRHYDRNPAL